MALIPVGAVDAPVSLPDAPAALDTDDTYSIALMLVYAQE